MRSLKHEQFLRISQACFALGVALGIAALIVALAGCWAGRPDVVYVTHTVTVHDEPRSCRALDDASTAEARDHALSMFPSLLDVGKQVFVDKLGSWVTAAGMCLGYEVYDVSWYLRPVNRGDEP